MVKINRKGEQNEKRNLKDAKIESHTELFDAR